MELRRYASLALKWLWLLVLGTLVAGGVAYQVSRSEPLAYQSSLRLIVNQTADANGPDYSSLMVSQQLTQTYTQLITSGRVLDAAYQKLGLGPDAQTSSASAAVVRDTQLITLSVEDENPQRARDVAQAIAEVFIEQRVADQVGESAVSQKVLRQQIVDLEGQMKETSQQIEVAKAGGDANEGELQRLQGVLSQYQVTYAQLVRSENDIQLANARFANTIKVVEPAELPVTPIRSKVMQNTLLGAIVGLLLALGVIFLVEYLDDTVKGEEDVAEASGLPTLAVVGRAKNAKGDRPLLTSPTHSHQLAEAFRTLRVNCGFAWAGEPGQVMMVTSPSPLEGKTTTAANLAVMLAQDSRKVIVVDGNLRRPSIHGAFDLDSTDGLSNLLADPTLSAESKLRETRIEGLRVLPAGPVPPNPAELLGSARFAKVVDELRGLGDVVVIDTPPLLGAVDASVIGRQVDGTIVVVAGGETRVGALTKAGEILERGSVRVLGVVLNKARKGQGGYHLSYYRYSSNGHSQNGKARLLDSVEQK